MEISLVNPNTRSVGRIATTNPPMGLLYMASFLRDNQFAVRFIDADVDALSQDKILDEVSNSKIVGITMTTMQATAGYKLAAAIKERYGDDKVVVAGGSHPSGMGDRLLAEAEGFDVSVVGEGEYALLQLAKQVQYEEPVKRAVLRYPRIENLNTLPLPAVDLAMPIKRYKAYYPKNMGKLAFPVMASRGCPFHCKFCGSNMVWGFKVRKRSPKSILSEVEWLKNDFGVDEVYFLDDGLNYDLRWCSDILIGLQAKRLHQSMYFKGSIRANEKILPPILVWQFKRSGFWSLALGVESGNQAIRDSINKQLKTQEIVRAFSLLRRNDINITASFMIGHIHDTEETIMETIEFALELNPDQFDFPICTPLPSTELEREAAELDLIRSRNWMDYAMGKAVMDTKYVKAERLVELRSLAFKKMYARKEQQLLRNPFYKLKHTAGNILRQVGLH